MIGWEKRVLLRHYLEQGMTKAAVAKLLGVSRRTVHYWIETEQLDRDVSDALSANVRETRSTQRIRVGRRQRKRTCWDCEREWKRMVVPLEPGRPSEARQLLRTRR